jgi:hypothetical protein
MAGPRVFLSPDRGESWEVVHRLSGRSRPAGALPTCVCEHGSTIYLAEYTLADEPARILRSDDGGYTWVPAVVREDIRHFHGVYADPYGDELWAAAGDTDGESAVGTVEDDSFRPVGRGSQRWRAVDIAFTREAIVWGMDCSYAPSVELLRLPRERLGDEEPTPTVVGRVDGPVFYTERIHLGDESWVVITTAAEAGIDSTAPATLRHNTTPRRARVLAAPVEGGLTQWREMATFTRRRVAAEFVPVVSPANAYVYTAAHPDHGLLLNPYNTANYHGRILQVSPAEFVSGPEEPARRRLQPGPPVRWSDFEPPTVR